MRRRHIITAAVVVLLTAGCGSAAEHGPDRDSPPPGAADAIKEYVKALNARDTEGLLTVGAAPDKPWSRQQAERIIRDKGGRKLTITKMAIEYEQMGNYLGKADLRTADQEGHRVREALDLTHKRNRWHVVLFDWPPDKAKPTSKA